MDQVLAIDFGGTNIKMGIVCDGVVSRTATLPAYSKQGLLPRLPYVEQAAKKLAGPDLERLAGIGVAMPGLVDPRKKCVTEIYEKYEDSINWDLESWFSKEFHLPIILEQDSKAALSGEIAYGCAKGYQDALMVILGTGVGTAVMMNGRILDSRNHFAGSLGSHIIIENTAGNYCTCGNRGCLEAHTASYALAGMVRSHSRFESSGLSREKSLDYKALKKWYDQGDSVAADVLGQIISSLRAGLISLVHCYDPAAVILSGGPTHFGQDFLGPLLDHINDEIWGRSEVDFLVSHTPDQSVLLGLAQLLLQEIHKA